MTDLREQLLKAGLVSKEAAAAATQPPQAQQSRGNDGPGQRPNDRGGDRQQRRNDGPPDRHNDRQPRQHDGNQPDRHNDRHNDRQQRRTPDAAPDLVAFEKAAISREQARIQRTPEERRKADQLALKAARSGRVEKTEMRTSGHRRWYFNTRQGALSWLELNDDAFTRIEDGRLAIVESPRGEAWLVGPEAAESLATIDATWLRAWNRRSR